MIALFPEHNEDLEMRMNTRRLPRLSSLHSNATSLALCLCFALFGTGCVQQQSTKPDSVAHDSNPMFDTAYSADADIEFVAEPATAQGRSGHDMFRTESASRRTRDMADWIVRSRDNANMPFAIIDKVNAKVYAFSASGQLYGTAPVLLGMSKGDYSIPGIGDKPLSQIPPSERTTPAGRFVSRIGRNHKGKEILWVDYDQSLSLHPVADVPGQGRPQRLASLTSSDNRISWGCINVPKPFFSDVIQGNFSSTYSVVYILPETKEFKKSYYGQRD